ncbi:MAG: glycosyltransferase family protein [Planctomycetota bacterium]
MPISLATSACGWWADACRAFNYEHIELPVAAGQGDNPHTADVSERAQVAQAAGARLAECGAKPDLLLDNAGTGLLFCVSQDGQQVRPFHETINVPLVSHLIDPLVTTFQGINWAGVWQCLQSQTWGKGVWDRAQVHELVQFGVPNVFHLKMAAPMRHYDTEPLDQSRVRPVVSFVGAQNSSYFHCGSSLPTSSLFPGVLANAVRSDLDDATFFDIYYGLYGLGEMISPDDPPPLAAKKSYDYFSAKLFYNAALCVRNRDRFVIFLHNHIGENFELIGSRWDSVYGLRTAPPIPDAEGYFKHFREVAINLNAVNGNAETGLNMRHFEITAAGGFMLCYDQPEIHDCFEVGKECVVFDSEKDLLEKIAYYLDNQRERTDIAMAGQQRTLSQHLYSHRLQELLGAFGIGKKPVQLAAQSIIAGGVAQHVDAADPTNVITPTISET